MISFKLAFWQPLYNRLIILATQCTVYLPVLNQCGHYSVAGYKEEVAHCTALQCQVYMVGSMNGCTAEEGKRREVGKGERWEKGREKERGGKRCEEGRKGERMIMADVRTSTDCIVQVQILTP